MSFLKRMLLPIACAAVFLAASVVPASADTIVVAANSTNPSTGNIDFVYSIVFTGTLIQPTLPGFGTGYQITGASGFIFDIGTPSGPTSGTGAITGVGLISSGSPCVNNLFSSSGFGVFSNSHFPVGCSLELTSASGLDFYFTSLFIPNNQVLIVDPSGGQRTEAASVNSVTIIPNSNIPPVPEPSSIVYGLTTAVLFAGCGVYRKLRPVV